MALGQEGTKIVFTVITLPFSFAASLKPQAVLLVHFCLSSDKQFEDLLAGWTGKLQAVCLRICLCCPFPKSLWTSTYFLTFQIACQCQWTLWCFLPSCPFATLKLACHLISLLLHVQTTICQYCAESYCRKGCDSPSLNEQMKTTAFLVFLVLNWGQHEVVQVWSQKDEVDGRGRKRRS